MTSLAFLLFVISSSLTPGPNNFLILNSGLKFGIRNSLPHFFGIVFGFAFMVFVVVLGLASLFLKCPWLNTFLKIAGSIYMLYLAWQIMRSTKHNGTLHRAHPMTFWQAVLFQWVNPKAWIMSVTVIALFSLDPHPLTNALLMSLTFSLGTFSMTGIWLVFGAFLKQFLKEEKHIRWFNITMALLLVVSVALLFFEI